MRDLRMDEFLLVNDRLGEWYYNQKSVIQFFSQLKVLKTSGLGCVWATFLLTYLLKLIVAPNNLSKNIKELISNR